VVLRRVLVISNDKLGEKTRKKTVGHSGHFLVSALILDFKSEQAKGFLSNLFRQHVYSVVHGQALKIPSH
jgi:hypothetical protein